jgi:lactate dehydrogenase-like 2-hydroxyacid dehydrogenase
VKPEVVIATDLPEHVLAALDAAYNTYRLWEAPDRAALLAKVGPTARGLATMGSAKQELIDALPNLEIISSFGVGVDGIDVAHATERNVIVANTPDVLSDEVANLAVTMLVMVTRKLCVADRYVREGKWEKQGDMPLADTIVGRTVGVIGFGRIGQAIGKRLEAFGCELCYHGPREKPDQPYPYYADPVALARDCDALVLACPGGAATRHLVNKAVLDALGPQGVLVNIARGSVVDEPALVAALQDGRLGGAALDVFEAEPKVPEALLKMTDNVVVLPHIGSATVATRRAMGDLVVENLRAYFAGEPVPAPFNKVARLQTA